MVVPVIQRIAEKIDEALEKSDEVIKVIPNGKYSIMHTIMDGRFSGRSELVRTVNSEQELKQFEEEHNITFMSRDEYLRNVQKNRQMDFYNFE